MIPETSGLHQGEEATALLTIHLREGFDSDVVNLRVAGQTVLEREDVSTDYSVGLAAVAEAAVAEGQVVVELAVPTQYILDRTTLDVEGPLYLAISIIDGNVRFQTSDEMFLYF